MPIYEYLCPGCEKVHEIMQKFSDPPIKKCPDCGGKVEKQMSLSSFALKGSGWYTSDYKRKPESTKAEPVKTESAKTEPAKPESPKPESKSEPKTTATPAGKPKPDKPKTDKS